MADETFTAETLLGMYSHKTVAPFLQRFGRFFVPAQLPSQFRRGRFKACFENSYRMAIRHSLVYVEGIAIHASVDQEPILHAWCVDGDGRVLDRTWRLGRAYFRIPFQTSYLRKAMAERKRKFGDRMYYGLLDDWEGGFPLIKGLADSPEVWHFDHGR